MDFSDRAPAYAAARPTYPRELAAWLAGIAPARTLAWEAGCGSGQLSAGLGVEFDAVLASDVSVAQLAHAPAHARVHYTAARAEAAPLGDARAALVVAAQAAHWFDLPRFFAEARRVAVRDGVVALVTYGLARIAPEVDPLLAAFYRDGDGVGRWWPAQRALVDDGYASLAFPFDEIDTPRFEIRVRASAAQFVAYVDTWSAVRRARDAGEGGRFDAFAGELSEAWGGAERDVVWPLALRVGRV